MRLTQEHRPGGRQHVWLLISARRLSGVGLGLSDVSEILQVHGRPSNIMALPLGDPLCISVYLAPLSIVYLGSSRCRGGGSYW